MIYTYRNWSWAVVFKRPTGSLVIWLLERDLNNEMSNKHMKLYNAPVHKDKQQEERHCVLGCSSMQNVNISYQQSSIAMCDAHTYTIAMITGSASNRCQLLCPLYQYHLPNIHLTLLYSVWIHLQWSEVGGITKKTLLHLCNYLAMRSLKNHDTIQERGLWSYSQRQEAQIMLKHDTSNKQV